MTQDTQSELKRLEAIKDVFCQPGFKYIVEDLLNTKANLNNLHAVKDEEQLFKTQGRLQQVEIFLNLEALVDFHLDRLNNPLEQEEDTY